MISHTEAQELHELIGAALEVAPELQKATLERARELAALIVSDTQDDTPKTDRLPAGA
jgi:hypothetical protein